MRPIVRSVFLGAACLLSLTACSQSSSSTQIPAGTSAALGSPNGGDVSNAPQGRMLDHALTSDTRQTLQQAMNSDGSSR